MAKLKVELERNDWQMLLMLAGQGYQELFQRIGGQLNEQAPPVPPANGEDKQAQVQQ
jgi:hypothetical protein